MRFSEKLKLIRKTNNLTQADFASSIGISRANLTNLELGNVKPTQVFINCVSLMYNVEKDWLIDDTRDDLNVLNSSLNMVSLIAERYDLLDDKYKKFVEKQINELLSIQGEKESE